jgi:hypothetical protein
LCCGLKTGADKLKPAPLYFFSAELSLFDFKNVGTKVAAFKFSYLDAVLSESF